MRQLAGQRAEDQPGRGGDGQPAAIGPARREPAASWPGEGQHPRRAMAAGDAGGRIARCWRSRSAAEKAASAAACGLGPDRVEGARATVAARAWQRAQPLRCAAGRVAHGAGIEGQQCAAWCRRDGSRAAASQRASQRRAQLAQGAEQVDAHRRRAHPERRRDVVRASARRGGTAGRRRAAGSAASRPPPPAPATWRPPAAAAPATGRRRPPSRAVARCAPSSAGGSSQRRARVRALARSRQALTRMRVNHASNGRSAR